MNQTRSNFSSSWGFILSAVGSAVGMANVWGFPAKLGANGGFAFLGRQRPAYHAEKPREHLRGYLHPRF